jgi:hypothetical protein
MDDLASVSAGQFAEVPHPKATPQSRRNAGTSTLITSNRNTRPGVAPCDNPPTTQTTSASPDEHTADAAGCGTEDDYMNPHIRKKRMTSNINTGALPVYYDSDVQNSPVHDEDAQHVHETNMGDAMDASD